MNTAVLDRATGQPAAVAAAPTVRHFRESGNRFPTAPREPLPLARTLRAYLTEARYELVAALRSLGFALPFIVVPVVWPKSTRWEKSPLSMPCVT